MEVCIESSQTILNKKKRSTSWKPHLNPTELSPTFPWLDTSKKVPFCKVCLLKITGGKFHLRRHEKTSSHLDKYKASTSTAQVDLTHFILNANKMPNLIKRAELKLAAYITLHNLPFLIMDSLPSLQKNIFEDSEICKNIHIKRKKAQQLAVGILAPTFKKELVQILHTTPFSLIVDETTDISVKKSLIIMVRFFHTKKVIDRILDLIELQDGKAETIFVAIRERMENSRIPYKNIIAFAAGGASTMQGELAGVKTKLKCLCPNMYVQTCSCHSLNICASRATEKLPNVIEQFARDIYTYFSHSSKRLSQLAECQAFLNEKPHKMLRYCQTRWLSLKVGFPVY